MAAPDDKGEPSKRSTPTKIVAVATSTWRPQVEEVRPAARSRTVLHMRCSIQSFETFQEEWCDEVHRIKSRDLIDDGTFINDAFIRNIARDDEVIKFLESKLGSLERIPLPQLILEIK